MLPHAIKALGAFLEDLERVCNKHKFTFAFQSHDRILHPAPLCVSSGQSKVEIQYSELQGLEFAVVEEGEK